MKKIVTILMALLMAISVTACGGNNGENTQSSTEAIKTPDQIVMARVDNTEITKDLYEKSYIILADNYNAIYGEDIMNQDYNGKKISQIIRLELLNSMITDIVIEKHLNDEGFKVEEKEVNEAYQKFYDAEVKENEKKQKFFKRNAISEDFIKEKIKSQLYMTEFQTRINKETIDSIDFSKPEYANMIIKVNAKHILVSTEEEAQKIVERLEAGEDFSTLAKELSKDPGSGQLGGELGFFKRGEMVPPFEEAAFSMKVGEVSAPVMSQFGYHIIKVVDNVTFSDFAAKESAEAEIESIKNSVIKAEYDKALLKKKEALEANHEVERFEENIGEPATTEAIEEETTSEEGSTEATTIKEDATEATTPTEGTTEVETTTVTE